MSRLFGDQQESEKGECKQPAWLRLNLMGFQQATLGPQQRQQEWIEVPCLSHSNHHPQASSPE